VDVVAVLDRRAEGPEGVEVRVEPAAADHVASGRGHLGRAEARQQRPGDQERGADALGERRVDLGLVHVGGAQDERVAVAGLDAHAKVGEELEQRLRVADPRHVVDHHRLLGQQRAGEERQRCVLVPCGHDRSGERRAAFDHELLHRAAARLPIPWLFP
jgi:hypothetical protein